MCSVVSCSVSGNAICGEYCLCWLCVPQQQQLACYLGRCSGYAEVTLVGVLCLSFLALVQSTTSSSARGGSLVRNRVLKNRKGLFRIRHLQESDLVAVAQLQVRHAR
jgi:hypothetical protein